MRDTLKWASPVSQETMLMLERAEDWLNAHHYYDLPPGGEARRTLLAAMVGFHGQELCVVARELLDELKGTERAGGAKW